MNHSNKFLLTLTILLSGTLLALICQRAHGPIPINLAAESQPLDAATSIDATPELRSYSALQTIDDWQQWIRQLRAEGVPATVLARLAQTGFENRWQARQAQAHADYMKNDINSDGLALVSIQRDRDEENEMRNVLGEAEFRRYDTQVILRSLPLHGIRLSSSESESLYDLEKNFQRTARQLNEMKIEEGINQADYDGRLRTAQMERDEQIKTLLGEERFRMMYPPSDDAADELRTTVKSIEMPTGVSFNNLVEIQKHWNDRRAEAQARLQEAKAQVSNCEDELRRANDDWETEVNRVLGANTASLAQEKNDPRYQAISQYADQGVLATSEVSHIYRTVQYFDKLSADYQQTIEALEAEGQFVNREVAEKKIRQFAQQLQQALRSYLGEDRFTQLNLSRLLSIASAVPESPN